MSKDQYEMGKINWYVPKDEILNPYSEVERLEAMLACSFKAVSGGFKHLPIRVIL